MIKTENTEIDNKIESLRSCMMKRYPITSILKWNGSKIPRGASVGGVNIDWTQHGMVYAGKEVVGMYDRLVEYGENDLQVMVLYTKDFVTDTQGNPCPTS